ncbi:aminotransferase class I/II-fold pyridoxal phosphate-dependent enzyme [Kitasatospora gansuensis]
MAAGLYPYFLPLTGHEGTTVTLGDQELVMCGSNNYLGLTSDPRVKKAAAEALDLYGTSCTGSRFLNGNLALHDLLEAELADFYGKPAAAVFSTGYQANLGVISALATARHGVRRQRRPRLDRGRQRAERRQAPPVPAQRRRRAGPRLAAAPEGAGRLVVVDGVYSMEGDLCALPELVATSRGTAPGSWWTTRTAWACWTADAAPPRTSASPTRST